MRTSFVLLLFLIGSPRAAEPIGGVTATATSAQVEKLFGPMNVCNANGLSAKGAGFALATNGYIGGGSMWHSGYRLSGADENPIIEFDFQKQFRIGAFHVWNHNGNPSRGFRNVRMTVSDDGKSWTPIAQHFTFAIAPGKDDYLGEDHAFDTPIVARYLRMHCESTHRGGGNRELAGLGKVRFFEATDTAVSVARSPGAGLFPDAAGVANVKLPPYGAKGDGRTDDTAAIQRAIDATQGTHRMVLLPEGTYLVSAPLRYTPGKGFGDNNFRGVGPRKSIVKLKDATFTDTAKPLPVLSLAFNGKPDGSGVHADWFNNNVGGFRIDTGRDNPGAIGVQFYSNNVGALREVEIISPDARGAIGLDLGYADQNGPCLVKQLTIDGFAIGVSSGATVNSQTAENVTIRRASQFGWKNAGQCLAIRGLTVSESAVGLQNGFGVVALIDSKFQSPTAGGDAVAIINQETLFARNIQTPGYKLAIENRRNNDGPTASAVGPMVDEWVSSKPLTLFPLDTPRSLNLPIQETPTIAWQSPVLWVSPDQFRELADADDSAAFQRAIDSGATTIYCPAGSSWQLGSPVVLRGKVQRIIGLYSGLSGVRGPAKFRMGNDGAAKVVVQDFQGEVQIDHDASTRTLIVQNGQGIGGVLSSGGELFLENVVADWNFERGRAWARQFNNEREGTHISNRGATLWILGLKTERGGTLIDTHAPGATEVLGGLSYTTTGGKLAPMFRATDARVSVVIGEVCYSGDPYTKLFEQTRGNMLKTLGRKDAPLRPAFLQGAQLPLFVAQP